MQITFDLDKPTARDLASALKLFGDGRAVGIAELLSKVVVECPKAWGDPGDVNTYADAPAAERLGPAFSAFTEHLNNREKVKIEGVTFDLSKVTPRQFDAIVSSANTNNVNGLAALLASFVKACPPEWGAPDSVDTYLDLKYYTEFRPLVSKLAEVGNNEVTNFLR